MRGSRRGRREVTRFPRYLHLSLKVTELSYQESLILYTTILLPKHISLLPACCHDAEPSKSLHGWLYNYLYFYQRWIISQFLLQPFYYLNLGVRQKPYVSTLTTQPCKCPGRAGYLRAVLLRNTLKLSNFAHCILQFIERSILNTLTTILNLDLGPHIVQGSAPSSMSTPSKIHQTHQVQLVLQAIHIMK